MGTEATWITARALAALRGRSVRATQELILRFERDGGVRVQRVPSRRGKPTATVCLEDYERWLLALQPDNDCPANDDR